MKKVLFTLLLIFALFASCLADDFDIAYKAENANFTVLSINPIDKGLLDRLDGLLAKVYGFLKISPKGKICTIKIFGDDGDMDLLTRAVYNKSIAESHSAYFAQANEIFVSPDYLTDAVLIHEITHAVLCKIIGSKPEVGVIQEVIACNMEYQIRQLESKERQR